VRETNTQLQPEIERAVEYASPDLSESVENDVRKPANSWFYVWVVWERRQFLARCALTGLIASLAIALLLPPEYDATTQLMPPDSDQFSTMSALMSSKVSSLSESPQLGKFATDLLGAKTSGALFIGVLRSRTVQDRMIDKFDLRRVYRVRRYDSARKELGQKTFIAEDRKSGIISVTVTDRDKHRAATMAQEYIYQLNVLMSELTTSRAHRERVFLDERLRDAKQELDSASKDLGEFSSKNATIDLKDEGKAIVEVAASLQGELIAAQSQLRGLEQIYSPNNVRVKSLRARIAELEAKLKQVGGANGITTGAAGDSSPDQNDNFLYPSLRQLPILGERYGDLYLRAKIAEKVYEFLTAQYEMARVEEAKEIPSVRVLDPAIPPERKSGPPRTIIVISGTLLFVVVGIFWILAKIEWNNLDAADPKKIFALEFFRVISRGVASSRLGSYFQRRRLPS
jgi:capsule polysaccharide export protein KpsE/RkpR